MSDATCGRVIARDESEPEHGVQADEPGVVYVLLDRVLCQVKIGHTGRPVEARQREVEYRWDRKLELVGVLTGGRSLERALLGRFRDFRTGPHREWFRSEVLGELVPLLDVAEVAA